MAGADALDLYRRGEISAQALSELLTPEEMASFTSSARRVTPATSVAKSAASVVAPNATDYLTQPAPTPEALPPPTNGQPTAAVPSRVGKVPEQDPYDPRFASAVRDVGDFGLIAEGGMAGRAADLAPAVSRAASEARPYASDLMRLFGDTMQSASAPAGAAALSPSSATAGDLSDRESQLKQLQNEALEKRFGPRPTALPEEQAVIDRLTKELGTLRTQQRNALTGLGPSRMKVVSDTYQKQIDPLQAQLDKVAGPIRQKQGDWDQTTQAFKDKYKPLTEQYPAANAAAAFVGPASAYFTGRGLGKNKYLPTAAAYPAAAALGGVEGVAGGIAPTYWDSKVAPEGSPAKLQADARLSDPNWWKKDVGLEAGLSGLAATVGATKGMLNKWKSNAAERAAAEKAAALPPSAPSPAALPAPAPEPPPPPPGRVPKRSTPSATRSPAKKRPALNPDWRDEQSNPGSLPPTLHGPEWR